VGWHTVETASFLFEEFWQRLKEKFEKSEKNKNGLVLDKGK